MEDDRLANCFGMIIEADSLGTLRDTRTNLARLYRDGSGSVKSRPSHALDNNSLAAELDKQRLFSQEPLEIDRMR